MGKKKSGDAGKMAAKAAKKAKVAQKIEKKEKKKAGETRTRRRHSGATEQARSTFELHVQARRRSRAPAERPDTGAPDARVAYVPAIYGHPFA